MNGVMRLIKLLEDSKHTLSIAQKQDLIFYLKRLSATSKELKLKVTENIELKSRLNKKKIKL